MFKSASNKEHHSFAIQANQARIDVLNQLGNHKIVLNIIDKKDAKGEPTGTIVKLAIPNEYLF